MTRTICPRHLSALRLVCVLCLAFVAAACDECKKSSDCGPGEICSGGKCKRPGGGDTESKGWPTATDSDTQSATSTSTASDTGTDTSTDTGTDTQLPGTCVDPIQDCPATAQFCRAYICDENAQCALANLENGIVCMDPANPCRQGVCIFGTCSEMEGLSGVPCTDDGNECTHDVCEAGACQHKILVGASCTDDGNACTNNICGATGECGVPLDGKSCVFDTDPCTEDKCMDGECVGTPINENASCDDGSWCNGREVCQSGQCTSVSPPCGEGTACAYFACTEPTGGALEGSCGDFVELADGAPCDDGVFCNGPDACLAGQCLHGPVPCDYDVSACTRERCEEVTQECVLAHKPDNTPCANDYKCDGLETCYQGECLAGPLYCQAINDCQTKECFENDGDPICAEPVAVADGLPCTTLDPCDGFGAQMCVRGACSWGETAACQPADQDANFCTKWAGCSPIGETPVCSGLYGPSTMPFTGFEIIGGTSEEDYQGTVSYDTIAGTNEVSNYGAGVCAGSFNGGEQVFKVVASGNTDLRLTLIVDAGTEPSMMRLLIISDPCSPASTCLAMSDPATRHVYFKTPASGNTYAVVDGLEGHRAMGRLVLSMPE